MNSIKLLGYCAGAVFAATALVAQTTTAGPKSSTGSSAAAASSHRVSPALQLPRLRTDSKPDEAGMVAGARATVHPLVGKEGSSARATTEGEVAYLAIDSDGAWSSPIRGAREDITFVSFFVYGSLDTQIEIAGAKIVVRATGKASQAQLEVGYSSEKGIAWRKVGGTIRIENYGGKAMAALPVITVRLNPAATAWDLYVGPRMVANDLPLQMIPVGASRQFAMHAGRDGARVCGLISSDDNPLFPDENRNGIEDTFEKQQNRGALADNANNARAALARQWQGSAQSQLLQSWAVRRPLPDGMPAAPAKGGK